VVDLVGLSDFDFSGVAMRLRYLMAGVLIAAGSASVQNSAAQTAPHNVVIFVTDGLRARSVNDATAPNIAALAREGVALVNGHSLFPTFTTANASAISTGHYLCDTGDFSNLPPSSAMATYRPDSCRRAFSRWISPRRWACL
jgi:predicted AlkP superfamily pyrophosphatase or phosphodiesterase